MALCIFVKRSGEGNSEKKEKDDCNISQKIKKGSVLTVDRRNWMKQTFIAMVPFYSSLASTTRTTTASSGVVSVAAAVAPSAAATRTPATTTTDSRTLPQIRSDLVMATETLDKLLHNWERAVIDCTYADVPRELLEQKNKELLLEKASTFALFDKSVSVTSCKTVVGTVRDYLGRTGIGPVAGLETTLKRAVTLLLQQESDDMDIERIDDFIQLVEDIQREVNRADGFSYSARRDFSSMNNFDPSETPKMLADSTSNLAQCKSAIQRAADQLRMAIQFFPE